MPIGCEPLLSVTALSYLQRAELTFHLLFFRVALRKQADFSVRCYRIVYFILFLCTLVSECHVGADVSEDRRERERALDPLELEL